MSNFQDMIKRFMQGDYETFDEIKLEEKKKNLSACIVAFKEKLKIATEALKTAKGQAVSALHEGYEPFVTVLSEKKNSKTDAMLEGYKNTQIMLDLDCDDDTIKVCENTLKIIKESFDNFIKEEYEDLYPDPDGEDDIQHGTSDEQTEDELLLGDDTLDEEKIHDAIPGVDATSAGIGQEATTDEAGDVDSPETQHELPVEGPAVSSAYQDGFEKGKTLYEKGIKPQHIAKQLAETEYANESYSYVTRFQEGVIAGCAFQEQVERDLHPELFENDEK